MPGGAIYVDVKIAEADDGPGVLGSGDDGKALVWDNGTGKFVMADVSGGGGGNVAYTDVQNTFLHKQIFQASIDDLDLSSEYLSNGDFDTDLTDWTPSDGDWSVSGGAATHAPGASATLTQTVTVPAGAVYVLAVTVSGITAGTVEIYDDENIDITLDADGTYKDIGYFSTDTDTITISVSDDFDGRIDSISFKRSTEGFPANMLLMDADGGVVSEIRTFNGSTFFGLGAGKNSQGAGNTSFGNGSLAEIVDESGNTAFGDGAGGAARCNNGLFLGTNSGYSETVDNIMHIGNNGDIIVGTMDFGNAATQTLAFLASICNFAYVPTSSAGLNPGDLYNDGGFAKFA